MIRERAVWVICMYFALCHKEPVYRLWHWLQPINYPWTQWSGTFSPSALFHLFESIARHSYVHSVSVVISDFFFLEMWNLKEQFTCKWIFCHYVLTIFALTTSHESKLNSISGAVCEGYVWSFSPPCFSPHQGLFYSCWALLINNGLSI